MGELLRQIHRCGKSIDSSSTTASTLTGPTDRLGLFGGVLESEVVEAARAFWLRDPEQPEIPEGQLDKALD